MGNPYNVSPVWVIPWTAFILSFYGYWLHEWLHKWFYKGFFPVWDILYKWLHVWFSPLLGLFPISMGWLHEWFSPYINNLVYWRSRSWLWNGTRFPYCRNQPLTRDYVPGTGCFWLELELVRDSLTVGISSYSRLCTTTTGHHAGNKPFHMKKNMEENARVIPCFYVYRL